MDSIHGISPIYGIGKIGPRMAQCACKPGVHKFLVPENFVLRRTVRKPIDSPNNLLRNIVKHLSNLVLRSGSFMSCALMGGTPSGDGEMALAAAPVCACAPRF